MSEEQREGAVGPRLVERAIRLHSSALAAKRRVALP